MSGRDRISREYQRFSREFARGVSDIYADLTEGASTSASILDFLETLPEPKRQPNLLLAAVKYHFGVPDSFARFETLVRDARDQLRDTMMARATQTNEPARCAALLPALAQIKGPLALLEVGASAGLCLLPDKYGYRYGDHRLGSDTVEFPCVANAATPLPSHLPDIAWRRGIDLNPLDAGSSADLAWLDALIWPGQEARSDRFRAAAEIARRDPPTVVSGDLLTDLEGHARRAPTGATLVIFHTTVLMYVPDLADRLRFAEMVHDLGATWIMNEDALLFPDIAALAPPPPGPGRLLMSIDGKPVAWTQPHGQSINWFGGCTLS